MALTQNLIRKIDAKTTGDRNMAKDLKVILNRCEEGRQTKKTIEDILKKLKNRES